MSRYRADCKREITGSRESTEVQQTILREMQKYRRAASKALWAGQGTQSKCFFRPVLSLSGSCYENLMNHLAVFLENLEEAKIKASSRVIRDAVQQLTLNEYKVLISLDAKSLNTNVPLSDSISLAANLAYRHREMSFAKLTFFELLRLVLIDVLFQVGNSWYRQVDGLAMDSKLAVYSANTWMSQSNQGEDDKPPVIVTDVKNPCGICTPTANRVYADSEINVVFGTTWFALATPLPKYEL